VEEGKREGSVTIGRGIGGVRMYVEEGMGRLGGIGVRGEIVVSGAGVGRGYIGDAGQTASRFVPDPYSVRGGERMYRTGDEGRWNERGEVEYLGRKDGQVKVRGYRVEVGEVEEVMRRRGGVKEAVVVVKGEGERKRLVGYYVKREGEEVEEGRMREEMRK